MKFKPISKEGGLVAELGPQEKQFLPVLPEPDHATLPVFHLKKILVPVDFSECSKKALQYAIALAKQFEAELTLLHVVQPYTPILEMAAVDVDSVGDAQHALDSLRALVQDSVRFNTLLRVGDPAVEILKLAKEFEIDLIVVATHGRTGMARVLMGSTTEKLIRQAGCPVLVVREREHDFVATTAQEPSQEMAHD